MGKHFKTVNYANLMVSSMKEKGEIIQKTENSQM